MKLNDLAHVRPALLVAIVGLSIVSAATAQGEKKEATDQAEPKVHGEFGKPLNQGGDDQPAGASVMTISRSNDGQTCTVTIKDGKVSAEINGKPVPEDRIERRRDAIILKDENGKEVSRFDVGRTARGGRVLRLDNTPWLQLSPRVRGNGLLDLEAQLRAQVQPENPPPVMLGVTMSDADEALLEHLNYESGVTIDRVLEGLPAAKSGLEVGDIIVELNGQKPVEQETIRAKLREAKPGDEIALKIVRKGKAQDIKLTLDAYDAEKLGHVWGQGGTNPQDWFSFSPRNPEVGNQIAEALKMLENEKLMQGEGRRQMEKLLKDAMKNLDASGLHREGTPLDWRINRDPSVPIVIGRNQGEVFEVVPGNTELSRKIDKLNATIDKLTERLEQLEKQLKEKGR